MYGSGDAVVMITIMMIGMITAFTVMMMLMIVELRCCDDDGFDCDFSNDSGIDAEYYDIVIMMIVMMLRMTLLIIILIGLLMIAFAYNRRL